MTPSTRRPRDVDPDRLGSSSRLPVPDSFPQPPRYPRSHDSTIPRDTMKTAVSSYYPISSPSTPLPTLSPPRLSSSPNSSPTSPCQELQGEACRASLRSLSDRRCRSGSHSQRHGYSHTQLPSCPTPSRYRHTRLPHTYLLFLSICLAFLPTLLAQTTSTGSSTGLTSSSSGSSSSLSLSSTSLSSSSSRSSSSASSTSSAPASATPSVSISGLPFSYTLSYLNSTHPSLLLNLPTVSSLYITLNLCSLGSNTSLTPTVLVSTASPPVFSLGTRSTAQPASGGLPAEGYNKRSRAGTTWLVSWDEGYGNWTWTGSGNVDVSLLVSIGVDQNGVSLGQVPTGNVSVQLSASSSSLPTTLSPSIPLIGDSTSTSALLFSPLLLSSPLSQPSYPNYTLPTASDGSLDFPSFSLDNSTSDFGISPNLSLIVVPTSQVPNTALLLSNSLCAVLSANTSTGGLGTSGVEYKSSAQWSAVGGEEGVRAWWVVQGLQPSTNYTTWIVDTQNSVMSSPTFFSTKEDSFPCPLVLPTPMCPSIGYAAALPTNGTDPIFTLPDDVASNLTSNLQSFSTSLLSHACGRDMYSVVSSCLDCSSAYRDWLCRIVIPQCASSSSSDSGSSNSSIFPAPSTIDRTPDTPRNPGLPTPSYAYTELLPCLGTCNTVDRVCPAPLMFRCPTRGITANESYAYVGNEDGVGTGLDSAWPALDAWGNRWCNG